MRRLAPDSAVRMKLTAHKLTEAESGLQLQLASRSTPWIDGTSIGFARRCLPLVMGSQGWVIVTTTEVRAVWTGVRDTHAILVEYPDGAPADYAAISHFGEAVLTWPLPWLFQTEPGWNLIITGPPNRPKNGVAPLTGLIETDWATASFTYNVVLTQPNLIVRWEAGEPIAMLIPQRRNELEAFDVIEQPVSLSPELAAGNVAFAASRTAFNAELVKPGTPQFEAGWQKDYFRGRHADGTKATQHQTNRKLKDWQHR